MLPPSPMLTTKNGAGCELVNRRGDGGSYLARLALSIGVLALLAGCTPSGPRALLEGRRLMEEERYPQAVEKLRAATALLGGTNAQAWNDLGLACHHVGDVVEAETAYRRALALNHDLSEAHFNLGCLCLSQNRLEAAKSEFMAYTLRRPNAAQGFLKLGATHLRARDLSAAEKSFNDALRLSPQNPEALNGLGLVRLGRGRAGEAARCFEGALKQQPDYRPALLNLAIVAHQYLKDRPLALQKYQEYLALKPPPANADALIATVRQLQQEVNPPLRPASTNAAPQVTLQASPPKPVATNALRVAGAPRPEPAPVVPKAPAASSPKPVTTNVPKPAPTVVVAPRTNVEVKLAPPPVLKAGQEVAIASAPAQGSAAAPVISTSSVPATAAEPKASKHGFFQRVNPVNLFRKEETTSQRPTPLGPAPVGTEPGIAGTGTATVAPPAGLSLNEPQGPPARYAYKSAGRPAAGNRAEAERAFAQGVRAQQARRLPEAIQAYRLAVQEDPSLFEAQYNLGLAAAEAGNLSLALTAYEAALAIQPASLDARYNFALVLKRANCTADAVNELERVVARFPNEARAHLALGNLYAQQMNQPAKARQHYLKVLELEPRHAQASAIRFWLAANPP